MVQDKQSNEVLCPTRVGGADSLICHQIDRPTCQSRQRGHYHKCHTCAHKNDVRKPMVSVLPDLRQKAEPSPVQQQLAVG